jgi:hypothetical protein
MSIQAKYIEKISYFENLTKEIDILKTLLDEKLIIKESTYDIEDLLELDNDIFELNQKVFNLGSESFTDYMLNVHTILNEYASTDVNLNFESIKSNFFGFVQQKTNTNKGKLYTEYMNVVENQPIRDTCIVDEYICTVCNNQKIISMVDSTCICKTCGTSEHFFDISVNGLTYEQEINTDSNFTFAYKRVNHFRELLAQLQAKESSDISDEIIQSVRSEFKKSRIKNTSEISQEKVKVYLKKLGFNKYYEHARQITNILNGTPPPTISPELNEKLTNMFFDIQEPFDKICPSDRKNFFSYNYILYKFCEILGETENMKLFPLLKSREKLYKQDCMWKEICVILNWTFYKSV